MTITVAWLHKRQRRWTSGYKILFCVIAVAAFVIILDGFVESGRLESLIGKETGATKLLRPGDGDEEATSELVARYAAIPVDHQDPEGETYQNRYWVNDKFYKAGGPVFVYDTGEQNSSGEVERFLQRPTSFMGELLQEFHGVGILWEHRYYGESLPVPINENSSADAYRFLSFNQSLADLPYFAPKFRLESHPEVNLSPTSTPWIMVGCSYSGTRAALSRLMYPDVFYAAYAGSTVVQFTPGTDDFIDVAYRQLVDHNYINCTRDLHVISEYIDDQLDDPESSISIKQTFLGLEAARNTSNEEFVYGLLGLYNYQKGWGIVAGKPGLVDVCDYLETDPITNETASEFGWAASRGVRYMTERLASYRPFQEQIQKTLGMNCSSESTDEDDEECDPSQQKTIYTNSPWTYQVCSEFGGIIHQRPGPHRLISKFWSLENVVKVCQQYFPTTTPDRLLSELEERVNRTNQQFGGWNMRPSNVFWTGGQYDPYRDSSPLARQLVDFGTLSVSPEIPKCNVSTGSDSLFGVLLPEVGHCVPIVRNTTQALETRKIFIAALREWLACL